MARPSTKKVTRAAQTGGGRTTRGSQPWLYWASIAVICILGTAVLIQSRQERRDKLETASGPAPRAGVDHWHAAYGIYICDKFLGPITEQRDPLGIHTHGDGVIHIHPAVRRAAGKNATLGKFLDAVQLDINDDQVETPDGKTYKEGKDKCDGKDGVVQIKVKGQKNVITENIDGFRFTKDRMVLTIAFAPRGAEIPSPPSEPELDQLSDVSPTNNVPATTPVAGDGSSTTVAGDTPASSTTEAPAASTTTAKP